jgi:hypothetical protein
MFNLSIRWCRQLCVFSQPITEPKEVFCLLKQFLWSFPGAQFIEDFYSFVVVFLQLKKTFTTIYRADCYMGFITACRLGSYPDIILFQRLHISLQASERRRMFHSNSS